MKTLYFKSSYDFIDKIIKTFHTVSEYEGDISIIAKYDEAKQVIEMLIQEELPIVSVRIDRPDDDKYYNEYIITLSDEGIWCEKMFVDGRYLDIESTVTYVLENCSSRVIPHCKAKIVCEVQIGDLFDDEYDCDACEFNDGVCGVCCNESDECVPEKSPEKCVEYSKDDNGDLHGFTASKSDGNSYYGYSVYTTDKLELKDIQSLLQEAGF